MTEADQEVQTGVQRAPLNKVWVVKIVVITFFLLGFGMYGLYDATIAYPARGEKYAQFCQWQYLQMLQNAESEQPGIFISEASVNDPADAYARLTDPETLARNRSNAADTSSTITLRSTARMQRLEWLKALRTIGKMQPSDTTMLAPREKLRELDTFWAKQESQPKALAFYDIPSQWLIMVVCWAFGAWLILLMLRTMARRYTFDASELRLTTPAGSFAADDLAEVDKRKWDKYIVFLRLTEGHSIGSKEMKFDTYRHAKLEEWILAMEEARFGPQEDGESPEGAKPVTETEPSDAAADATESSDAPESPESPESSESADQGSEVEPKDG